MSIRARLSIWFVTLLGLILILFGIALYGFFYYTFHAEVDSLLLERASQYGNSVSFVLSKRSLSPEETLSLEPPPIDIYSGADSYMELRFLDGRTAARSESLGEFLELPLFPDAIQNAQRGQNTIKDIKYQNDESVIRLISYPIIFSGQPVAIVQSAKSMAPVGNKLRQIALIITSVIIVTLLLALWVGISIVRRALQPVDSITRTALDISRAEDLSRRLHAPLSQDELGRLVNAFNEMLGRLDDVFRDQQRFVADVSHELRTPLTSLQSTIEFMKRGIISDPADQQEAMTLIESEVARLNRLVTDLLLLARADAGQELPRNPVELDTILLNVFREARLLAEISGKPLRVRLGHEDRAIVMGDADRLKQLLLNLAENAIKYTPQGTVTLSLYSNEPPGWARLVVADTGIGIPAESLSLLFRRFYRVDKARSRELSGTGLGLAIAQWIVEAHGGHIEVESEEGTGSTFTVSLPLAPLGHAGGSLPAVSHTADSRGSDGQSLAPA